jgi:hypothetical protein
MNRALHRNPIRIAGFAARRTGACIRGMNTGLREPSPMQHGAAATQ